MPVLPLLHTQIDTHPLTTATVSGFIHLAMAPHGTLLVVFSFITFIYLRPRFRKGIKIWKLILSVKEPN